ncbi:MAG: arginine repressor [Lachnospiraceae bacterium]|nr:arginine repressor [Lachnospiraceae bacterium]
MKKQRLIKIKELISKYDIDTQEELCEKLNGAGFAVTQATVSRDIRELRLTKIQSSNGGFKYALLVESEHYLSDKYLRVLKDGYISMDTAQNLLVVKTVSGMAMAVAAAIDSMKFSRTVGSIAGDDTIMIAFKSEKDADEVYEKIKSVIEE